MAKNSEICERAVENIEQHGWIKGEYGNPRMGFCAVGAMSYSAGATCYPITTPDIERFNKVVEPVWGDMRPRHTSEDEEHMMPDIPIWNDRNNTSKSDVIDLLTEAAKYWRNIGE